MAPPCSGQEAGALLGCLQCRVTMLWLPGATDVSQHKEATVSWLHWGTDTAQEGNEGSLSCHGHAGARRALALHPELPAHCTSVHPAADKCWPLPAPYSHRAWAVPRNPPEVRQQHGIHQGLLRKPRVLSWRGKEQRKQHRYHI